MGTSSQVRALAFDVLRTIIDTSSVSDIFSDIRLKVPNIRSFIETWQSKQLQYAWMMTLTGVYQSFDELSIRALKYTAKINGLKLTFEQIKAIQDQQQKLRPFPDVKNGLEQIKSQLGEVEIIVLTNGGKEQTEKLLDNAEIRNYFSEIVSVEAVKRYKPSPQPYHKAAEEANISIIDIVLVSSNLWDIMGAQIIGMKTCWVNRESYGIANEEIDGVRPTYNVSSIEDIPNVLKSEQDMTQ